MKRSCSAGRLRAATSARDIAKRCGFSLSTVTKVLRRHGDRYGIKPASQAKILKAAKALHYRPNFHAQFLRTGRSGFIVILGQASFPIRTMRQHAAALAVRLKGYRVQVFDFCWEDENPERLFAEIEEMRPEGVLIAELTDSQKINGALNLMKQGIPIVGLDYLPGLPFDQVFVPREQVGCLAAQHLIALGHRHIAYVISKGRGWYVQKRLDGFRRAFHDAGLSLGRKNLVYLPTAPDFFRAGYEVAKDPAFDPRRFSAIAAISDQVAMGLLRGFHENGIGVPEHLSMIGAENLPESEYLTVPLTSIRFPLDRLAAQAVEVLLDRIRGKRGRPRAVEIQPSLVIRASCKSLVTGH